jgi:rRNA-processing protein FCF1
VLVVEGAARRVQAVPGVRVVAAGRSGDDAIVELCRESRDPETVVVTADRALRDRVRELGARVVGPSALQIRR